MAGKKRGCIGHLANKGGWQPTPIPFQIACAYNARHYDL